MGRKSYSCTRTGEYTRIEGGYVKCPEIQDFCEQLEASCPDDCNLNGRCLKGNKCYCYPGFKGKDCKSKGNNTNPIGQDDTWNGPEPTNTSGSNAGNANSFWTLFGNTGSPETNDDWGQTGWGNSGGWSSGNSWGNSGTGSIWGNSGGSSWGNSGTGGSSWGNSSGWGNNSGWGSSSSSGSGSGIWGWLFGKHKGKLIKYKYTCANHCSKNGYCFAGRCACNTGFSGKDCSRIELQ